MSRFFNLILYNILLFLVYAQDTNMVINNNKWPWYICVYLELIIITILTILIGCTDNITLCCVWLLLLSYLQLALIEKCPI